MNDLIVTLDLDWAAEPAIDDTLNFLEEANIRPTVFVTHRSPRVEAVMDQLDVGLHPFFGENSSHGSSISEVVKYVMALPHNLPAFRCHRFGICNASKQAMAEAGMLIASNVCTDLEIVPPFKDRFGLLEIPVFLEDGGYLWCKHPLELTEGLKTKLETPGIKILIIHPMHFALNTPYFSYMYDIKQSVSREAWKNMSKETIRDLRWKGRGIRDFLVELLQMPALTTSLKRIIAQSHIGHYRSTAGNIFL